MNIVESDVIKPSNIWNKYDLNAWHSAHVSFSDNEIKSLSL